QKNSSSNKQAHRKTTSDTHQDLRRTRDQPCEKCPQSPRYHMLEPVLAVVKECNDDIDDETIQAWTTLYLIIADLIEIYRNKK
ncbi:hypothetical protein TELCIR_17315, partial [Teladorsagia circumcincta]